MAKLLINRKKVASTVMKYNKVKNQTIALATCGAFEVWLTLHLRCTP